MSGVTHFERRDRQRRNHDVCHFCEKRIKGTPKGLAGERGNTWVTDWVTHLRNHILENSDGPNHIGDIEGALRTAMSVAREFDRNK